MKKYGWILIAILLIGLSAYFLTRPNYIKEGTAALEQGKYQEAISLFDKQIAKKEQLEESFLGQGIAYYELKDYETCVLTLQKAIRAGVTVADIYRFMGNSYMELEQYEAAIKAYTQGMAAESASVQSVKEMKFNRIVAYEKLCDWESAKEMMEEYLTLFPNDEAAKREAEFLKTR